MSNYLVTWLDLSRPQIVDVPRLRHLALIDIAAEEARPSAKPIIDSRKMRVPVHCSAVSSLKMEESK